jgi:exodeoxyribonuclease V alpha subunit
MTAFTRAFTDWPVLQEAWQLGMMANVDIALARHLLDGVRSEQESTAAFLCHLFLASRCGHLCVDTNTTPATPHMEEVWAAIDVVPTSFRIQLETLILQGIASLPENLFAEAEISNSVLKPIVHWHGCYYLHCHWISETRLINAWRRHEQLSPTLKVSPEDFHAALAEPQNAGRLLPEQAMASAKVAHNTLSLITGGPGTGKTHTAGILLSALWRTLSSDQKQSANFAIAAPTGKAAAQLQHSLNRSSANAEFPPLSASTLHSLLGITQERTRIASAPLLPYDLLMVDESSMIDTALMDSLLNALKPGARLILLGDHWQLPPVQAGAPFAELIRYRSQMSSIEHQPSLLQRCLRAELREIVEFATAVRNGNIDDVWAALRATGPLCWRPLPSSTHYSSALDELAEQLSAHTPQQWRLLSPLRQGPWGVDALNALLHRRIQRQDATRPIPILLTANHHHLQLYNGEVGILHYGEAIFNQRADGTTRKVPVSLLPAYEYGYCLSVHKSQGSECDHVRIILPPGSHMMGRELLYTAVTRARCSIEIWCDPETLTKTLARPTVRISNTAKRLQLSS